MKKYSKILILLLVVAVAFAFIVPSKVMAVTTTELAQADFNTAKAGTPTKGLSYVEDPVGSGAYFYKLVAGNYTITGNIDLEDAQYLDLLGDTSLSGTGTIKSTGGSMGIRALSGVVTINGGTYKVGINTQGASKLVINDGTFDTSTGWGAPINVNNANAEIKGGTLKAAGASAMYFFGDADVNTLTISGGKFESTGDNGIEMGGVKTLTISGGTFKGLASGITFPATTTVKLSGGEFTATGTTGVGGIYVQGSTDTTIFNNYLVSGYEFSPALQATAGTGVVYTQKAISVVNPTTSAGTTTNTETTETPATTTETAETTETPTTNTETAATTATKTTSNPPTGDNVVIYAGLLTVAVLGSVITLRKLK